MYKSLIILFMCAAMIVPNDAGDEGTQEHMNRFLKWLKSNRDAATGLPYSHVGDPRFKQWTLTYDSAVVTLAYIAADEIPDAKKVLDFYIETPSVWRLDGIIEAFIPADPIIGKDWSVRTGANLWMGMAAFHLYKTTGESKYLEFSMKIADLALFLQNKDSDDENFGGVRLGPSGDPVFSGDQHIGHKEDGLSFSEIYPTEINVDAYALFNMLFGETKDGKYKKARQNVLIWLKNVAYNPKQHRFNRGFNDELVATDVQSWGISALGVEILNTFEKDSAEKMIEFVENNCLSEVAYTKPDGTKINVLGVDFIDRQRAAQLERGPLVTPEWTFQLINAYRRLEKDFENFGNIKKVEKYKKRREELMRSMVNMAVDVDGGWAYPYATSAEALIGHEYRTPKEGNLSTISVTYAILALKGYEPLNLSGGN